MLSKTEEDNKYLKMDESPISKVFLRPNAIQNKSEFLYTIAYQLHLCRNAIVKIVRGKDEYRGVILALEPLNCEDYLFGQGYELIDGTSYLKVKEISTNEIKLLNYADIIHIRLNPNDMFYGDKNDQCDLTHFVKIFDENLGALLKELKDAGSLRGVVEVGPALGTGSFNNVLIGNTEKVDKAKEIIQRIKDSPGGIIVLDSGEKWTSLTRKFDTMTNEDVNNTMKYLYNFKGINQAVIDGTATEAQMGVFFNKTIVPIIMRLIEELNAKILTLEERKEGQKIEYFKNPFEYTSIKDLLKHLYLGAMYFTQNEIRRMAFKMPPLPGGDKLIDNKNFTKGSDSEAEGGDENSEGNGD